MARPMPRLDPVMTATLPVRSIMGSSFDDELSIRPGVLRTNVTVGAGLIEDQTLRSARCDRAGVPGPVDSAGTVRLDALVDPGDRAAGLHPDAQGTRRILVSGTVRIRAGEHHLVAHHD